MEQQVLRVASRINEELKKEYTSYLDECARYRRAGYRPHYCEHGTDQWVDYDNICGGCEEGYTLEDGAYRMRLALDRARDDCAAARKIMDAFVTLTSTFERQTGFTHGEPIVLSDAQVNAIANQVRILLHSPCDHPEIASQSFVYGAPGYGGGVSCTNCNAVIEDRGGILTEADVR